MYINHIVMQKLTDNIFFHWCSILNSLAIMKNLVYIDNDFLLPTSSNGGLATILHINEGKIRLLYEFAIKPFDFQRGVEWTPRP